MGKIPLLYKFKKYKERTGSAVDDAFRFLFVEQYAADELGIPKEKQIAGADAFKAMNKKTGAAKFTRFDKTGVEKEITRRESYYPTYEGVKDEKMGISYKRIILHTGHRYNRKSTTDPTTGKRTLSKPTGRLSYSMLLSGDTPNIVIADVIRDFIPATNIEAKPIGNKISPYFMMNGRKYPFISGELAKQTTDATALSQTESDNLQVQYYRSYQS